MNSSELGRARSITVGNDKRSALKQPSLLKKPTWFSPKREEHTESNKVVQNEKNEKEYDSFKNIMFYFNLNEISKKNKRWNNIL